LSAFVECVVNVMKFAEVLLELIEERGLSLRKLEHECGVTSSQLSKYLKGFMPSVFVAVRLANYFGVTLDFLFGLEDENRWSGELVLDVDGFVSRYEGMLDKFNMSHYKIAKKTSLSESSLRRWRKGHVPSTEALVIIAETLSISIDYLVCKES